MSPAPSDADPSDADPSEQLQVLTGTVAPATVAAVLRLCDRAGDADGVYPLSEHVVLHVRHGGEGPDRHLVLTDGGEVIGYAHLDPTDPVAGPVVELVVDPKARGLGHGRRLVEAAAAQARAATGTDRLRLWAHGDQPAAHALAQRYGFTVVRRLEQWRRSLFSALPPVTLPPGVVLRSFRPGEDDAAWLALNARAFAHHPEQGSWTPADLAARMAESWFDPEGFLLAERVDDAHLVGFHWTKVHGGTVHHGHAHEAIGEVYVVGVDPDAQGQGLGRALTLAGLHRLRGRGLSQAMLYVEGDNLPAQAVYRALGFTPWDADVMFSR